MNNFRMAYLAALLVSTILVVGFWNRHRRAERLAFDRPLPKEYQVILQSCLEAPDKLFYGVLQEYSPIQQPFYIIEYAPDSCTAKAEAFKFLERK